MFWIDLDWILLFNWLNWCLTWLEIFNWFQFIGFSHHFLHAIILPDLGPAVCVNNCGTICSKTTYTPRVFFAFAPTSDVCRRCDRRPKEFRLCTGQRPRREPVDDGWKIYGSLETEPYERKSWGKNSPVRLGMNSTGSLKTCVCIPHHVSPIATGLKGPVFSFGMVWLVSPFLLVS